MGSTYLAARDSLKIPPVWVSKNREGTRFKTGLQEIHLLDLFLKTVDLAQTLRTVHKERGAHPPFSAKGVFKKKHLQCTTRVSLVKRH